MIKNNAHYIRSKKLLKITRTTLEAKIIKNNAHYIRSKKLSKIMRTTLEAKNYQK